MTINELLSNLTLEDKVNLLLGNRDFTNYNISNLTIDTFNVKSINKLVNEKINKMSNCFDVDLMGDYILNKLEDVRTSTILDLDLVFSTNENLDSIFKNKILRVLCQNFFVLYRTNVYEPLYEDIEHLLYYVDENLVQFKGKRAFTSANCVNDAFRKINEGAMLVFLEDDNIREEALIKVREYVRYFNDYNRKEITEEQFKNYLDSLGESFITPEVVDERLTTYFTFLQDLDEIRKTVKLDSDDVSKINMLLTLNNHVLLKNEDNILPLNNNKIITMNFKHRLDNLNIVNEINNIPFNNPVDAVKQIVEPMIDSFDTLLIKLEILNDSIAQDKLDIVSYFKSIGKKVVALIQGNYIEKLNLDLFDSIIYRNYTNADSDKMLGLLLTNVKPFNGYLTSDMLDYPYGHGLSFGDVQIDDFKNDYKNVSVVVRNNSKLYGARLVMVFVNNILEDFKSCEVKADNGEKVYLSLTHVLKGNRENKISLRCNAYTELFGAVIKKSKEKNMIDNEVLSEFVDNLIVEKEPVEKKVNKFKYLIFILVVLVAAFAGKIAIDKFIIEEYARMINLGIIGLALILVVINLIKFFKSTKKNLKKFDVEKALNDYTNYNCLDVVIQEEPVYEQPVLETTESNGHEVTELKKEINYDYKEELNHEVNSIDFVSFYDSFNKYLEDREIKVDRNLLTDLLSSMTMSRLIFLKGNHNEIDALLHALFNFFDNEYNITNISGANNIIDLYETTDDMTPLLKTMLSAKENKEKIYMSVIYGLDNDTTRLFETNLADLDSKHVTFTIDLGINKVINLPKNLWYFVIGDDYYNLELTKNSVTVYVENVTFSNPTFDLSEKPIDVILYNREISRVKENYYLNEEEYKKLDLFYEKLAELSGVKLTNKELISIENFISSYKMFNDNDLEVIDKLILMRFIPFIKTVCVEKDIKNEVISSLNNLFGENILLRTIKALNE